MKHKQFIPIVLLILTMLACSLTGQATSQPQPPVVAGETSAPAADTPVPVVADTAVPTIVHTMIPGELPAGHDSEVTDRDSSVVAGERRATGGENFALNLYERPFNADTMDTYFPGLDIQRARLYVESPWIFVAIRFPAAAAGQLNQTYGVEIDLNVNGRGNVLVLASQPGPQWSTDGVQVWTDNNFDVGSNTPVASDAPVSGNGYETQVFNAGVGSDSDLAWARLAPGEPDTVQIAFKSALINDDGSFTWGAWALNLGLVQPGWFDLNDHFTHAQAGSPLPELSQYYPVKQLAELDNTCRWGVGFTPTGSEPGVCPVPATPTPVLPGTVSGVVFNDGVNGDRVLDATSIRIPGATVRARSGSCAAPGGVVATATTNGSGVYTLTLNAGTYCIDVNPDPPIGWSNKTSPQTVNVTNGAAVNNVNFGYSQYLGIR